MDYNAKDAPGLGDGTADGAAEVREPAVAYVCAGTAAGADVWDGDDTDDADDWEADPEHKEYVYRMVMEAEAKVQSGQARFYPHKEAMFMFWSEAKAHDEAAVTAGLMPPQPQEYWDSLERKIEKYRL